MYQSLVSFDYWTLVAQLCNFGIQILLFKRFLFTPVKNILEKRQQEVNSVYDEAAMANEAAQKAKEEYETSLATVRQESDRITEQAVASAKMQSDQIIAQAQADAAQLLEKANKDIELERSRAMTEAKGEISKMAIEIASKVVEKEIDEKTHEALIGKFIDELGE